ncbi:hypothetical protein [Egicoccus halophilus]|uniref:LPXTG-motif cell wall anchor domain-containing protein n=1 Tax=Egicoccus halophilus TaxID=1670830 RepID=A0A8J3A9J2_9ACTN|nr:hypothetical protein [Egicoccus halophilus]GGI05460.1 hypothetical protein GCM10011354_14210 [Egicoccus halophilus]
MRGTVIGVVAAGLLTVGSAAGAQEAGDDNICHYDPTAEVCVDEPDEVLDRDVERAEPLQPKLADTGGDLGLAVFGGSALLLGAGIVAATRRRGDALSD